jgi:protein involved in polysaccharide export with SLBB domain
VGAGDTLLVAVYNHPELAIATYAGVGSGGAPPNGRTTGLHIDNDGTIQFPLIGTSRWRARPRRAAGHAGESRSPVTIKTPG